MPIAHMIDGAPKAEIQPDGSIGLYATDNTSADPSDPYIGFLFPPVTALAVALRLLARVQESSSTTTQMLALQSVEGRVAFDGNREPYAHVAFGIEGAKIDTFVDRAALAKIVAALSALLSELE